VRQTTHARTFSDGDGETVSTRDSADTVSVEPNHAAAATTAAASVTAVRRRRTETELTELIGAQRVTLSRRCELATHTHTHTHPFTGSFSGTTQASWHQKGKTNLDFTEARDSKWQWHQMVRIQVCISLQTDNNAMTPAPHYSVFYSLDALPAAQPTVSKH